jgi:hypothetical protein
MPHLVNDLTEIIEPIAIESTRDRALPILHMPYRDRPLPNRKKLLQLTAEPK